MKANFVIGLGTALAASYLCSSQRFKGFDKNDAEVAYYGALTTEEANRYETLESIAISEFLDSSDRKSSR